MVLNGESESTTEQKENVEYTLRRDSGREYNQFLVRSEFNDAFEDLLYPFPV